MGSARSFIDFHGGVRVERSEIAMAGYSTGTFRIVGFTVVDMDERT